METRSRPLDFSGERISIIAEIGINHNGSIERAFDLIHVAKDCGADAVKFQKRTIDIVYSPEELARPRESPFGSTNGDLKRGLEFGEAEYHKIDRLCNELGIQWYASPWDLESVEFLNKFKCRYLKIASACLTDSELLKASINSGKKLLISTGMADLKLIRRSVDFIQKNYGQIECLYHCTSTYPTPMNEINLLGIKTLQQNFPDIPIGYSGHEPGVPTSVMAAALGAVSIERHITMSRADWGSDQAASLDPEGFRRLCRDIRRWEDARGDGRLRIYDSEKPIIEKLRRNATT